MTGKETLTTVVATVEPLPAPDQVAMSVTGKQLIIGKTVDETVDVIEANKVEKDVSGMEARMETAVGRRTRAAFAGLDRIKGSYKTSVFVHVVVLLCLINHVGSFSQTERPRGWVARLNTVSVCSWRSQAAAKKSETVYCACHLQHRLERERAQRCNQLIDNAEVQKEECQGDSSRPRCEHPSGEKSGAPVRALAEKGVKLMTWLLVSYQGGPLVSVVTLMVGLARETVSTSGPRRWIESKRDQLSLEEYSQPASVGFLLTHLSEVLKKLEDGDSGRWQENDRKARSTSSRLDSHEERLNKTHLLAEGIDCRQLEILEHIVDLNLTTGKHDETLSKWVIIAEGQKIQAQTANKTLDRHGRLLAEISRTIFSRLKITTAELIIGSLSLGALVTFAWLAFNHVRYMKTLSRVHAKSFVW